MSGGWPVDTAFVAFSVAAVATGFLVFRTDSMVRASFLLLASFLNVGAILILMAAEYLGAALFFMMTVEMIVMALFMVMFMMNPAGLNPMNMVHQPRFAAGAGLVAAIGIWIVAWAGEFPDVPVGAARDTIHDLGTELLGGSMLVFESAGVTLLATMVCAVILSSSRGRYGDGSRGLGRASARSGRRPPPRRRPGRRRRGIHGGHGGNGHGDHGHGGHG